MNPYTQSRATDLKRADRHDTNPARASLGKRGCVWWPLAAEASSTGFRWCGHMGHPLRRLPPDAFGAARRPRRDDAASGIVLPRKLEPGRLEGVRGARLAGAHRARLAAPARRRGRGGARRPRPSSAWVSPRRSGARRPCTSRGRGRLRTGWKWRRCRGGARRLCRSPSRGRP